MRTYNLTPGRELLFACRYRLGTASNFVVYMSEADNVYDPLYGSFVGDQGAWSTAKMYFTVPPNGVAKTRRRLLQILDATLEADNAEEENTAASALLLKHKFLDGGADDVTLATLGKVLLEPTLTTLGNFFGALQQPELRGLGQLHGGRLPAGGLRHDPERLGLEHCAHLHLGAGETLLLRYRLGTASNLVMYVSAADNDYVVGVTGTFLGTALQGVWSTARLDFSVAFGGSISGLVQQSAGTLDLYSMQIRASAFEGDSGLLRSAYSHRHRRRGRAVVHRGCVRQLAEHQRGGQRGPAELRHRNHRQHTHYQQDGQRRELHHGGRRVHGDTDGLGRSDGGATGALTGATLTVTSLDCTFTATLLVEAN